MTRLFRAAKGVGATGLVLLLGMCVDKPYGSGYMLVPTAGPAVEVVPGQAVPVAPIANLAHPVQGAAAAVGSGSSVPRRSEAAPESPAAPALPAD